MREELHGLARLSYVGFKNQRQTGQQRIARHWRGGHIFAARVEDIVPEEGDPAEN
jgi:hypothetical protein